MERGPSGLVVMLSTSVSAGPLEDRPRSDIDLVSATLGATVVAPPGPHWSRRLEDLAAADVRHALAARALQPAAYLSFSERLGAPAALLDRDARHVCVAHNFNSKRRLLERATHWMRRLERVVVVSARQREVLVDHGISGDRVVLIPDYVDAAFFDPALATSADLPTGIPTEPFVLAVGQEQRDYDLLLAALAQAGAPSVLVPSSSWVQAAALASPRPAGSVVRTGLSYPALRALYAAAALVVVPVVPGTQYAAGVNGLLEAMAMDRPLVVTATPGLEEYLDETCMRVVPAGDVGALADAIRETLAAGRSGGADRVARDHVLQTHTVEAYSEALAAVVSS